MELCATLRDPAHVPGQQLRTANFSDDDRVRFGEAVKKARRAAGFRSRRAFAEAAGVGKRSIDAVELFEPVVGEDVLTAIGIALGNFFEDWSQDTPRAILEDGFVPSNILRGDGPQPVQEQADEVDPDPDDYPDMEDFLRAVIKNLRRQGVSHKAIMRAVARVIEELERNGSDTERNNPDTHSGQVG